MPVALPGLGTLGGNQERERERRDVGRHHCEPLSSSLWALCLLRSPAPPFFVLLFAARACFITVSMCALVCCVSLIVFAQREETIPPPTESGGIAAQAVRSLWIQSQKITQLKRAALSCRVLTMPVFCHISANFFVPLPTPFPFACFVPVVELLLFILRISVATCLF